MKKEGRLFCLALALVVVLFGVQFFADQVQTSNRSLTATAVTGNDFTPTTGTNDSTGSVPADSSGQPANIANSTDADCGVASQSADYRTGQTLNAKYCATPSEAPSSQCSLSAGTKAAVANTESQAATAVLAAATLCISPDTQRQNLCGKPCTFKTTLTGAIATEVTVTGQCVAVNKCEGESWSDLSGNTHQINAGQTTQVASNQQTPATVSQDSKNTNTTLAPPASTPATTQQTPQTTSAQPPSTSATNQATAVGNPTNAVQPSTNAIQTNSSLAPPGSAPSPALITKTAPVSTTPTQSSAPVQTFNPNPGLNIPAQQITPISNPFPQSTSVYSGTAQNPNSYTATTPTFGGRSGSSAGQSYIPTITSSSPLTNFVSSVANLSNFFGFLTSVFTPTFVQAPAPPAQTTQVIVQPVPTITTVVSPGPQLRSQLQLSNDSLPSLNSGSVSWQQEPSSFIHLITSDQQTLSPIDIATIIQGSNGGSSPVEPIITQLPANSPILSLLEQAPAASLADNSSINLQIPQITSLALNTVNGLENYQNVPEQFYIEEAQLAQAQSNYAWLQAQIEAWQNAQSAGVCDNACQKALTVLESEVSGQAQQVRDLQAQVDQGPQAFATTTTSSSASTTPEQTVPVSVFQAPGASQAQVVSSAASTLQTPVPSEGAPYYVKQNDEWCDQYDQCIPSSAFQPAPISQVIPTNSEFSGATTTAAASEDPVVAIVRTIQGWINDVVSIFTPNTTVSNRSGQSCSLFKSLVGGCSSGW